MLDQLYQNLGTVVPHFLGTSGDACTMNLLFATGVVLW